MPRIVLVTSTSRICRYLVSNLLSLPDCPAIRLIVRDSGNTQESFPPQLRSVPHSIVAVEYFAGPIFISAFKGVSIVFHNGQALLPVDEAMGIAAIDAAKEAGVQHFVFASVLQPMRVKLGTHKMKLKIEEYLVESQLNYTILQPPHLMQNIAISQTVRSGKIPLGYSPSISHGFVDLLDVIEVIVKIILNPSQHNYARYELVGQNITYDDIARVISRISRKNVRCEVMSSSTFVAKMKYGGEVTSEYAEDSLTRLLVYFDRWGLKGNSNTLRWILGREPTSWDGYVARELR